MVFALSGRISEHRVPDLQELLKAEARPGGDLVFDLEEVKLVGREAVRFLAACEAEGIKLKSCPSYIREWIETGSDRGYEPRY